MKNSNNHLINLSIEEARTLIQTLTKMVENMITEKVAKEQLELKQEISKEYIDLLKNSISNILSKLARTDFPKDIMCNHFGIRIPIMNDDLQFACHSDNQIRITLYRSRNTYYSNGKQIGYSCKEHELRKDAIQQSSSCKIADHWNDNEGSSGFSVIIKKKCPKSLMHAISRARDENSVDRQRKSNTDEYENFKKWLGLINEEN